MGGGRGGGNEDASYPMILSVTESNQPKICIPGFIRFIFLSYQAWNGNVSNSRNSREEKKIRMPSIKVS